MSGGESVQSLAGLFEPRSVAIIGASSDPAKPGGRPLRFLRASGFAGEVYPVNARAEQIQGYPAYASLADIPHPVEHAIVIVPATACRAAIEECAAKGVRFVQVFSSGFGEAGPEGVAAQDQLRDICRAHGMRMLGPNCLGVVSVRNRFFATFSTALEALDPMPGAVAVVTQSGAFGSCAYSMAIQRGLGLSRIVATGNEADLDVAQCIEFLAEDAETSVICAAIEGCGDGDRLRQALYRCAQRGKPVVMIKVGSSEAGMAAAATHTGSLAGDDAVFDAVFAECGAWRAHSIEEMLDIAEHCVCNAAPANRRAHIATLSGGIGVLMADVAEACGLELPKMAGPVAESIGSLLPFAPLGNPLDTTTKISALQFGMARTLELLLRDTDSGTVLLYMAQLACAPQKFEPLRQALTEVRKRFPERCVVLIGPSDGGVRKLLQADRFTVVSDPSRAMAAAGALAVIHERQRALRESGPVVRPRHAGLRRFDGGVANEAQAKRLLAAYGIPVLEERICTSADDAVAAARALGLPAAAKILSPDIPHKTEIGGVMLDLRDEAEVRQAFGTLMQRAAAAVPGARIDGVLIAPMAGKGIETILGVHMDHAFGPMILFGLGGIAVELYKDTAFASAPLTPERALGLVRRVRASRLLEGWRGEPALDVAALVQALVALSELAVERADELEGIDINPFLVRRTGAVCLDALVSLRTEAS